MAILCRSDYTTIRLIAKSCIVGIPKRLDHVEVIRNSDNQIVAYVAWRKVCGTIHITEVATHPMYRRKGYAKELLQKVMKYPAKNYVLEVRKHNLIAQTLYTMLGFHAVRYVPIGYIHPLDGCVYMSTGGYCVEWMLLDIGYIIVCILWCLLIVKGVSL